MDCLYGRTETKNVENLQGCLLQKRCWLKSIINGTTAKCEKTALVSELLGVLFIDFKVFFPFLKVLN